MSCKAVVYKCKVQENSHVQIKSYKKVRIGSYQKVLIKTQIPIELVEKARM